MDVFTQLPYVVEALFAAGRIVIAFVLLFGFIAPLFLSHTKTLPNIEKLIYSWIGLGGGIIISVFILTIFHIYDFISLAVMLLLVPFIVHLYRSDANSLSEYIQNWELQSLIRQVQVIEDDQNSYWQVLKAKVKNIFTIEVSEGGHWFLVFGIALAGGLIRMYPALQNASPFSRGWFDQLNRIKEMRLQNYFTEAPVPGGMHSLVSVFSMLTQVSPEMILHLLGALTSFFLCIIVYWISRDITKNRYPFAPIIGMSLYAVVPMLFLPVSLDQQVEASSVDLALCFALPTLTIFIRNLRATYKSPWFYIFSGFIATGFTNLFVAFVILLPLSFLGLLTLPRRRYFKSFLRLSLYLVSLVIIILLPFIIYGYFQGTEPQSFLLSQLYDIQAYSYFPELISPIQELSKVYIMIAGGLLGYYIIDYFLKDSSSVRDEIIFVLVFIVIALRYTPVLDFAALFWLDTAQLNELYALMIGVLACLMIAVVFEICDRLINLAESTVYSISWVLLVGMIASLIYLQGGIRVSRVLPSTMPNGFFEAYYQVIDERLPYSYATVGPEVQRIQAKNRHFYMDYEYFLDEYGAIDSLYQQQLTSTSVEVVPPASIFVFTEKAPYGNIQQGILYDSPAVMRDLEQWLADFEKLPDRKVSVFYDGPSTRVYEIINRPTESKVKDILFHIYPGKRNTMFDE
ncbi:hypothetical protein [Fodinibius halophilus]|uniref:Uncharacterized protein n=1 Tax=Fodinibius halophilus TaxID=1736908 RepID=A0A6M1T3U7_9BACT|nr:hypothetical protein [Fodinibius halophilus]NGP87895.1 hypothetical protein [Fodinibius halophilus]